MNYLKITKYIYLVIGLVMLWDAYMKWHDENKPWLSIILAGLAFFTFFFRGKFSKKFEDRDKQMKQNNQNNPNVT